MKQKITEILQTAPLSISQTRRAGTNGLRNADEMAELIVAAVGEREAKLVAVLKKIIDDANIPNCDCIRCGHDDSHAWNCPVHLAKETLKELGVEE